MAQYAHIVPESDGGEYEFNNLLYLCYECHRKFEPAAVRDELKKGRTPRMRLIRDRGKIDNLVGGIFDELISGEDLVVRIGRGLEFVNTKRVFEEVPARYSPSSYLDIEKGDGILEVSGLFKDETGKPLISFHNMYFHLFTGDFWDIVRKPGKLEVVNLSKKVRLQLYQNNDLSISIMGKFFLGNMVARATESEFTLGGNTFINNTIVNSRVGLGVG